MRISRFYLIFIWIASLFSIILFLTSVHPCQDKKQVKSEDYMTDTELIRTKKQYLLEELRKRKETKDKDRVDTNTRQDMDNVPFEANIEYKKLNGSELYEDYIASKIDKNKRLPLCSSVRRHLQGRMNIPQNVTVNTFRNKQVMANIKYGGTYRPSDCKANEKVAIIIPYRDRIKHLEILVNYLHAMLQQQKLNYGMYVVEMALPVQFNRGLLANAGFMTAQSIGNYSCYIIHDVDLIPINDFNSYTCSSTGVKHLVARSSKFEHGELPYNGYIGGVLALTREQLLKMNGFSNLYFGWGGEDDDMYKRITSSNITLDRVQDHIGVYTALSHDDDSSNPPNPYREILVNQAEMRMKFDGLSSIKYHRKSLEFRQLYTWILIDCVESEIMENYAHLRINSQFIVNYDKKLHKMKTKTIKVTKLENGTVVFEKG